MGRNAADMRSGALFCSGMSMLRRARSVGTLGSGALQKNGECVDVAHLQELHALVEELAQQLKDFIRLRRSATKRRKGQRLESCRMGEFSSLISTRVNELKACTHFNRKIGSDYMLHFDPGLFLLAVAEEQRDLFLFPFGQRGLLAVDDCKSLAVWQKTYTVLMSEDNASQVGL